MITQNMISDLKTLAKDNPMQPIVGKNMVAVSPDIGLTEQLAAQLQAKDANNNQSIL